MFLLDTCVLSEGMRPAPDPDVTAWWKAQENRSLHISAITAGELRFGVERLPDGRRAVQLRTWLDGILTSGFAGRIMPLDEAVADLWGRLRVTYPSAEIADSQIAATALAHGMTLVTRNVKDFAFKGLSVFNPWRK